MSPCITFISTLLSMPMQIVHFNTQYSSCFLSVFLMVCDVVHILTWHLNYHLNLLYIFVVCGQSMSYTLNTSLSDDGTGYGKSYHLGQSTSYTLNHYLAYYKSGFTVGFTVLPDLVTY